ncbi:PLP-dependent cysteine synthase family protein [Paenirhodobacter sp.]|uniref:PLP-dependent cysteine synthase family protein n=1 Tax=Paenirhodobacter sp. TaxID=1965326 RepID=UPI003B41B0B0
MARIHNSLTDLIGDTPLVELHNYRRNHGLGARILVKIEYLNPAGSVKDRLAWALVQDAEERGLLTPGATLVDVTSGNTGIALAAIGAARGYRVKIYASDNISPDKFRLLEHYGAEVVKVDNAFFLDPEALEKITARIREENPDAVFTDQLANPANPEVHYRTTGPEIWEATGGVVDAFVAGVGTGGTISGVGRYLKERNPSVHLAIAEPAFASLPSEDNPHPPEIDGVHHVTEALPEQLPANFARDIVDEIVPLDPVEAAATARQLAREEGILAGTSAGAILFAATELARRPDFAGKTIVALLPDSGERYLNASTFRAAS